MPDEQTRLAALWEGTTPRGREVFRKLWVQTSNLSQNNKDTGQVGSHLEMQLNNTTNGPFIPTTLTLSSPREVESMDYWSAPNPTEAKGGDLIYTESVVFRRHLKIQPSTKPGKLKVSGELLCQPCSEELCWPPRTIPLSLSVTVKKPKTE